MGNIRPLQDTDIGSVAVLFQKIFGRSSLHSARSPAHPPARALADYLETLYLRDPFCAQDTPPLVHVADNGALSGFVGRHVLPMRQGERPLRAALLSSIMVDEHESDPLTGARLLRTALAGPQDFSLSDTASELSVRMWQRSGGMALPGYSLDWTRVIGPAAFLTGAIASRFGPASFLSPLALRLDRVFRRRIQPGRLRWAGLSNHPGGRSGFTTLEIDRAAFADLFTRLTERFALRPDWSGQDIDRLLASAESKADFGRPSYCLVQDSGHRAVGGFFYHLVPGGTARIFQLLALPRLEEAVLDKLIDHAAAQGASAVRGRTQPPWLEAMLGKRIAFVNTASTVVHSRDSTINEALLSGQSFLNGLAGEQWSRLIGDRFD